jgi:ABC-type polysaccharide/polyol phosphate export permease
MEVFRDPIYYGKIPPMNHLLLASGLAMVALAIGIYTFRRMSDRIALYV